MPSTRIPTLTVPTMTHTRLFTKNATLPTPSTNKAYFFLTLVTQNSTYKVSTTVANSNKTTVSIVLISSVPANPVPAHDSPYPNFSAP